MSLHQIHVRWFELHALMREANPVPRISTFSFRKTKTVRLAVGHLSSGYSCESSALRELL